MQNTESNILLKELGRDELIKRLLHLHQIEGNKWRKIADALQISESQVKNLFLSFFRETAKLIKVGSPPDTKSVTECFLSNISSMTSFIIDLVDYPQLNLKQRGGYKMKETVLRKLLNNLQITLPMALSFARKLDQPSSTPSKEEIKVSQKEEKPFKEEEKAPPENSQSIESPLAIPENLCQNEQQSITPQNYKIQYYLSQFLIPIAVPQRRINPDAPVQFRIVYVPYTYGYLPVANSNIYGPNIFVPKN